MVAVVCWWQMCFKVIIHPLDIWGFIKCGRCSGTELRRWEVQVLWQWSSSGPSAVSIVLSVGCTSLWFQKQWLPCCGNCEIRTAWVYFWGDRATRWRGRAAEASLRASAPGQESTLLPATPTRGPGLAWEPWKCPGALEPQEAINSIPIMALLTACGCSGLGLLVEALDLVTHVQCYLVAYSSRHDISFIKGLFSTSPCEVMFWPLLVVNYIHFITIQIDHLLCLFTHI